MSRATSLVWISCEQTRPLPQSITSLAPSGHRGTDLALVVEVGEDLGHNAEHRGLVVVALLLM